MEERQPTDAADAFRIVVRRLWSLIAFSDTTQTRFFLSLVSALWTIALLLPGDSFSRPTFEYMAAIAGDYAERKWTVLFATYATAGLWRVFSTNPNQTIATIINSLGAIIFCAVAYSVASVGLDPFPAGVAAHFGIALAAVWVLVRTHVNSASGWRHD